MNWNTLSILEHMSFEWASWLESSSSTIRHFHDRHCFTAIEDVGIRIESRYVCNCCDEEAKRNLTHTLSGKTDQAWQILLHQGQERLIAWWENVWMKKTDMSFAYRKGAQDVSDHKEIAINWFQTVWKYSQSFKMFSKDIWLSWPKLAKE